MNLDTLMDDARLLFVETHDLKYADDPNAYNTALAKLMGSLKKEPGIKVTNIRQNYKGTGSKKHVRQLFVRIDGHERGGPDVWLDNGFVKVGGVIDVPRSIPSVRKYGEDPPGVVYKWIADCLKQVMAWQDAKYQQQQTPQQPKPESKMSPEINKKLESLRRQLEADLGEEGTPQYTKVIKASGTAKAIPQAKMTGGSTPRQPPPAKNAIASVRSIAVVGAQSSPPAKKVKDSVLPSKMGEDFGGLIPAGFRRLAGLDNAHRLPRREEE